MYVLQSYRQGTRDEHSLTIQPSDKVSDINKDGRVDSLTIVLTNATATTPKSTRIGNLGAEWPRGGYMYEAISTEPTGPGHRQGTHGNCRGQRKVVLRKVFLEQAPKQATAEERKERKSCRSTSGPGDVTATCTVGGGINKSRPDLDHSPINVPSSLKRQTLQYVAFPSLPP